jgi:hypothetical protein
MKLVVCDKLNTPLQTLAVGHELLSRGGSAVFALRRIPVGRRER